LDVWMEVLVLVCSKLTPKLPLTVALTSTIQTRSLETMFAYSEYHLILHWNHYLCSSALSHWLATVSRPSWPSWEPSRPFLCSWSYPFLVFSIKRHWRLSVLLTSRCFLLL
jgi:hypothetical protein